MPDTDDTSSFNPRHRIAGAVILVSLAVIFLPLILSENPPAPPDNENMVEIPERDGATKIAVTSIEAAQVVAESAEPPAAPTQSTKSDATPVVSGIAAVSSGDTTRNSSDEGVSQEAPVTNIAVVPLNISDTNDTDTAKNPIKEKLMPAKSNPTLEQQASTKAWLVQVGTYYNANNANRVSDKLKRHGYSVKRDGVMLSKGKAVRVRVGPYQNRLLASKAQATISQDIGIKGYVVATQ